MCDRYRPGKCWTVSMGAGQRGSNVHLVALRFRREASERGPWPGSYIWDYRGHSYSNHHTVIPSVFPCCPHQKQFPRLLTLKFSLAFSSTIFSPQSYLSYIKYFPTFITQIRTWPWYSGECIGKPRISVSTYPVLIEQMHCKAQGYVGCSRKQMVLHCICASGRELLSWGKSGWFVKMGFWSHECRACFVGEGSSRVQSKEAWVKWTPVCWGLAREDQ